MGGWMGGQIDVHALLQRKAAEVSDIVFCVSFI